MQLHKGAQGKHATAVGVTAVQNNSAAACLATGVNRLLKCSGVVGCSISQGTEIYYMIVHNLLHYADFFLSAMYHHSKATGGLLYFGLLFQRNGSLPVSGRYGGKPR